MWRALMSSVSLTLGYIVCDIVPEPPVAACSSVYDFTGWSLRKSARKVLTTELKRPSHQMATSGWSQPVYHMVKQLVMFTFTSLPR